MIETEGGALARLALGVHHAVVRAAVERLHAEEAAAARVLQERKLSGRGSCAAGALYIMVDHLMVRYI